MFQLEISNSNYYYYFDDYNDTFNTFYSSKFIILFIYFKRKVLVGELDLLPSKKGKKTPNFLV